MRQIRGGQGVDGSYDVSLDAGDFHQTGHRIAGQSQEILHGKGGSVGDGFAVTAQQICHASRRHGRGGPDLCLASSGGPGHGCALGNDAADSGAGIKRFHHLICRVSFFLLQ